MNLLSKRDGIFKSAHQALLKPAGFVLRSSRSVHHRTPLHRAVVLASQPTDTQQIVDFDMMIIVAHDEFNPHCSLGVKPGLAQRNDALLNWGLRAMAGPSAPYWSLREGDDAEVIQAHVFEAIQKFALPILAQCETLQGLVEAHAARGFHNYRASSWLLNRLGQRDEAVQVIQMAVARAPHEKSREKTVEFLKNFMAEAKDATKR